MRIDPWSDRQKLLKNFDGTESDCEDFTDVAFVCLRSVSCFFVSVFVMIGLDSVRSTGLLKLVGTLLAGHSGF